MAPLGVGDGKNLPRTLTINRAAVNESRKLNDCGKLLGKTGANYCSVKNKFPKNHSCDQYPFSSTTEGITFGKKGKTATRCVPDGQNSGTPVLI
jgi:hypothetical protein